MKQYTEDELDSFLLIVEEAGSRAHALGTVLLANGIDSVAKRNEHGVFLKPRGVRGIPDEMFTLGKDTIEAFSVDSDGMCATANMVDGRRLRIELCRTVQLPYTDMDEDDGLVLGEVYRKQERQNGKD